MAAVPATPLKKTAAVNPTTPTTAPPRLGAHTIASSPHYTTTRRHSLYGTEDRIILDPGSRVWKVGFSGEGRPRDVYLVGTDFPEGSFWSLSRILEPSEREERERELQARLQAQLRSVFFDSLLTDPKSRKVIIIEHPLLPLGIKDMIARILFSNLQVPSISFAPSHLLSLLAAGRMTGLVLDCGHLESTVLPVYASRPLYPLLRTSPLAGSRLTSHLRALLLLFGTYLPPPATLSGAANLPQATRSTRVPEEVLTNAVVEDIKTRCCFVGDMMDESERPDTPTQDDTMSLDIPPSSDSALSESDFSRMSTDNESVASETPHAPRIPRQQKSDHLQVLASLYKRHSTAKDVKVRVIPPVAQQTGTGRGTLIVPGWIRERAAEVLFEGGDADESSVAEVILNSLLNVPVDLRKDLASNILIVGGTPMLPGFIPRLHRELIRALTPPSTPSDAIPTRSRRPPYDPYAPLRQLGPYIAILNNPSPPDAKITLTSNAGKAPAFAPGTMAWVGGSLAGALKTGGEEILRERWDEADAEQFNPEETMDTGGEESTPRKAGYILPDWTRSPLPVGAPPANPVVSSPSPSQLAV